MHNTVQVIYHIDTSNEMCQLKQCVMHLTDQIIASLILNSALSNILFSIKQMKTNNMPQTVTHTAITPSWVMPYES